MKLGNKDQASETVHAYWTALAEQNWDNLKSLFAEGFEAYWPQSKELFKSADAFIEMNRTYPGKHRFQLYNSTHSYDQWEHHDYYISEVQITSEMRTEKPEISSSTIRRT